MEALAANGDRQLMTLLRQARTRYVDRNPVTSAVLRRQLLAKPPHQH